MNMFVERKSVYRKNMGDGKICSKWLSVRPKIIEIQNLLNS